MPFKDCWCCPRKKTSARSNSPAYRRAQGGGPPAQGAGSLRAIDDAFAAGAVRRFRSSSETSAFARTENPSRERSRTLGVSALDVVFSAGQDKTAANAAQKAARREIEDLVKTARKRKRKKVRRPGPHDGYNEKAKVAEKKIISSNAQLSDFRYPVRQEFRRLVREFAERLFTEDSSSNDSLSNDSLSDESISDKSLTESMAEEMAYQAIDNVLRFSSGSVNADRGDRGGDSSKR